MLKSDLVQTDKHSIKILLRRKNLRFLRRTNLNTKPLANILKHNMTTQKLILLFILFYLGLNHAFGQQSIYKSSIPEGIYRTKEDFIKKTQAINVCQRFCIMICATEKSEIFPP